MTDWRTIAQAAAPELPAEALDRMAAVLRSLEESFRSLVKDLPPGLEPCTQLRISEDDR